MALVLKDRVLETSVTTGTGTITLDGAVVDYQGFTSAIGAGNTTYYTITHDTFGEWEVGIGTVGTNTLTRDTVLSSSNGGSKVNFTAGSKNVFCDYPASKSVYQAANGLVSVPVLNTTSTTSTTPNLTFNASNSGFTTGASVPNSYLQAVLQNSSGTTGASTNYVVSNDLGTDSTYYAEFGMNSSAYSSGTPADFFSINNEIYLSGHDGDIAVGSGNGYKTYFPWGTSGNHAHVINASGAIGLDTSITGTTNFGTAGQVLTSQGSSATPTWTSVGGSGTVTSVGLTAPSIFTVSGSPVTSSGTLALTYSGTALPIANGGTNSTSTPTAGGAVYGTGTAYAITAAGTSGAVLTSNGASAPTWSTTAGVNQSDVGTAPNQIPLNQYLGTMAYQDENSVKINGGAIDNIAIGATTASTGAFTTLSASSTVSGAGFSTYLASPPAIGGTTPAAGTFSTLRANSTISLNGSTGTAGQVLTSQGASAPTWTTVGGTGTVTSVGGTGTVNGLTLTGTVTTTGNLTLGGTLDLSSPPAIGATAPSTGKFTTVTANGSIAASSTTGAFNYGAASYSDTNHLAVLQTSVDSYAQVAIQNTSATSNASADIIIGNNNTTASTFYGSLGMNSSAWTGTAGTTSLSSPNMVYLTSTSADLTIGTTTSNAIRFVTNGGADKLVFDASGNVGIGVVPTGLDLLELGAGTTAKAPLGFTSGSLLTTSDPGSVEYDGTALYFTPTGTSRALTNTSYFYRKNTATTLASATGNQAIFALTSGATVAANTIYQIECEFQLSTSGTTSHTEAFGFTLATATVTNMGVAVNRLSGNTTSTALGTYLTSVTPVVVTGALTTAQVGIYRVKGTIAFGTGGSINPVVAFSAAPGGTSTIVLGSWMKLTPIGTTGSNVSIGTWA